MHCVALSGLDLVGRLTQGFAALRPGLSTCAPLALQKSSQTFANQKIAVPIARLARKRRLRLLPIFDAQSVVAHVESGTGRAALRSAAHKFRRHARWKSNA